MKKATRMNSRRVQSKGRLMMDEGREVWSPNCPVELELSRKHGASQNIKKRPRRPFSSERVTEDIGEYSSIPGFLPQVERRWSAVGPVAAVYQNVAVDGYARQVIRTHRQTV